jgi:acetyl esterase/lipase
MPGWFVQRGFVFVAVNFRLAGNRHSPDVKIPEMASDIAKALRWLHVNGRRYGGRTSGFVLLGYSSGAHLAALVATHEGFLRKYRLRSNDLLGVIAMDVPQYDVPLAMRILETEDTGLAYQRLRLAALYSLFGSDRLNQQKVSPAAQVGPWLTRTAFLLVSAGLQLDQRQSLTRRVSEHFMTALRAHGIGATHCHLADWEHADLVRRWGGELAACVEQFLDQIQAGRGARTLS